MQNTITFLVQLTFYLICLSGYNFNENNIEILNSIIQFNCDESQALLIIENDIGQSDTQQEVIV